MAEYRELAPALETVLDQTVAVLRARAARRAWTQRHLEAVALGRERFKLRCVHWNAQTRAAATRVGAPRAEAKVRFLREHSTQPAIELALDLGHTLKSVRRRRERLESLG